MSPALFCTCVHTGCIFHKALGVIEANDSGWLWPILNKRVKLPQESLIFYEDLFSGDYFLEFSEKQCLKNCIKIVTLLSCICCNSFFMANVCSKKLCMWFMHLTR